MSYPVQPKKLPKLMSRQENLEWELECLKVYRSRCRDPIRLPGYDSRMFEIEQELKSYYNDIAKIDDTPMMNTDVSKTTIVEPMKTEVVKEQIKEIIRKPKKTFPKKIEKEIVESNSTESEPAPPVDSTPII